MEQFTTLPPSITSSSSPPPPPLPPLVSFTSATHKHKPLPPPIPGPPIQLPVIFCTHFEVFCYKLQQTLTSVLELHDGERRENKNRGTWGGEKRNGDSEGKIHRKDIKVSKKWTRKEDKIAREEEGKALSKQGNKRKNRRDWNVDSGAKKKNQKMAEDSWNGKQKLSS